MYTRLSFSGNEKLQLAFVRARAQPEVYAAGWTRVQALGGAGVSDPQTDSVGAGVSDALTSSGWSERPRRVRTLGGATRTRTVGVFH